MLSTKKFQNEKFLILKRLTGKHLNMTYHTLDGTHTLTAQNLNLHTQILKESLLSMLLNIYLSLALIPISLLHGLMQSVMQLIEKKQGLIKNLKNVTLKVLN